MGTNILQRNLVIKNTWKKLTIISTIHRYTNTTQKRNFNKLKIHECLIIKLNTNSVNLKTYIKNINYCYNNLILLRSINNIITIIIMNKQKRAPSQNIVTTSSAPEAKFVVNDIKNNKNSNIPKKKNLSHC